MNYLQTTDYEAFGLPIALTQDWVTIASAVIDSHCRRESLGVTQYSERLKISAGAGSVHLSYFPLCVVAPATSPFVSLATRFATPRRGELIDPLQELVYDAFSIPGTWVTLDATQIDWAPNGTMTVPRSSLMPSFNELNVTYTAGLQTIPNAVKSACALIIKNAQSTTGLNVKASRVDMVQVQYFSDSLVDDTVRMLLRPWVANRLS